MKYRTVIEVVCSSSSEEDAAYTAGEYLRGNVLCSGVEMNCYTAPLNEYLVSKTVTLLGVLTILIASIILIRSIF